MSIQGEGSPCEQPPGNKSEKNARDLRDTGHEEDDEGKEDTAQSPDEEEKILRCKTLKLDFAVDAFIDLILGHTLTGRKSVRPYRQRLKRRRRERVP